MTTLPSSSLPLFFPVVSTTRGCHRRSNETTTCSSEGKTVLQNYLLYDKHYGNDLTYYLIDKETSKHIQSEEAMRRVQRVVKIFNLVNRTDLSGRLFTSDLSLFTKIIDRVSFKLDAEWKPLDGSETYAIPETI